LEGLDKIAYYPLLYSHFSEMSGGVLSRIGGRVVVSSRDRVAAANTVPSQISVRGVVTSVHEGEEGFVSTSLHDTVGDIPEGTHITFSLKDWSGNNLPRKGQMVSLEQITLFEKGWRALCARPISIGVGRVQRGEYR
jgi:hypothetical protein